MQQIVVVQFVYPLGREARKICESRITLATAFFGFLSAGLWTDRDIRFR
jgi:hypothetical protein